MEFWGVEVKPGQTLKVEPGEEKVLHLSQACLGEVKKGKDESVLLHVKVGDQKLVVGTLSAEKCPQIAYDLVFEQDFELSHSSKNGSIYFCGYRSVLPDESDDFYDSDSELGEDFPLDMKENGKSDDKAIKDDAKKVKLVDPKKGKKPVDDEDEEDDDEDEEVDSEDGESDDEDMLEAEDGSDDDEDDESSDEDEETPTPKGKKRPSEAAAKKATPGTDKKAKLVSPPQKSGADGKKGGGHTATPYPKGGRKTPASGDKSKQSPKSVGSVSCKTCSKTFVSDSALQSHSKAKHK